MVVASVFCLFNSLKKKKVTFFKVDGGCGPRFWPSQRLSMSKTGIVYVRGRDFLCPRQKLSMSETESVYFRDRECLCLRQRMSMSETESFSETHTECFRVINWPPSRLRTCFRHQSESKWCEKFAGNVRNVRNTLKIMKIRLQIFPHQQKFKISGTNYVDVELKIKLFCGFKP